MIADIDPGTRSPQHSDQIARPIENEVGIHITTDEPRPVFLIGTHRSGASLLTLSLGQHPNLVQCLETNWFERFAIGLRQSYTTGIMPRSSSQLDVAGIEIEDFFEQFGRTINDLMLRSRLYVGRDSKPTRWIDGSQSNSFAVFPLLRLFPHAKFIHVLRDAGEVIDTLTSAEKKQRYKSRHILMGERRAADHWLEVVTACVEAERAFGSDTVLRIRRSDLVEEPEPTLRRCLAFLDEPFAPACLRPFRGLGEIDAALNGDERDMSRPLGRIIPPVVGLLSEELLDNKTPCYRRDEEAMMRLEIAFSSKNQPGSSNLGRSERRPGKTAQRRWTSMSVDAVSRRLRWTAVGQVIRHRFHERPTRSPGGSAAPISGIADAPQGTAIPNGQAKDQTNEP